MVLLALLGSLSKLICLIGMVEQKNMRGTPLDFEFYVLHSTRPVYSFINGQPIFGKEERVLVSGFLSALDSFAQSTMKGEIESLNLSNSRIYFRRDDVMLLIVVTYAHEFLGNVKGFFNGLTPIVRGLADALTKVPIPAGQRSLLEQAIQERKELLDPREVV